MKDRRTKRTVSSNRRKGKEPYGRLIGRMYDHFFSSAFTRRRLIIRGALERFAEEDGGRVFDDAYTELFPKVSFEGRRYEARIVITPAYRGFDAFDVAAVFTSTDPDVANFPFPVIQVYSNNLMERFFSDPCMKKLITGDETFDYWFSSRSLSPFPLRDLLGSEGKRLVFRLNYLYGRNNLYLTCQGPKLLLRKSVDSKLLADPETYRALWRPARLLFRRLDRNLKLRFGTGRRDWIRIIEVTGADVANCPVCGEVIFFNRIECARCDTPHHLDCWEYAGQCATYACECRDYHFPRVINPRA